MSTAVGTHRSIRPRKRCIVEVLCEEGIDGVQYALWDAPGLAL